MKIPIIFGIVFTCMGLGFIVSGVGFIRSQYHRCTSFVPVEAVITSKTIDKRVYTSNKGKKTFSYKPIIKYRYKVKGIGYGCDKYMPFVYKTSDYNRAQSIIDSFKVGQKVKAYYNPDKPDDAYLLKRYFFSPYLFTMLGVPFFSVGILFFVGHINRIRPPKYSGAGLYEFKPIKSIDYKFKIALMLSLVWTAVGIFTIWHYFAYVPKPYDVLAYVGSVGYWGLAAIPWSFCLYYMILRMKANDPILLADKEKFPRGEKVKLQITQRFKAEVLVEELIVSLICIRYSKTRKATKADYTVNEVFRNSVSVLQNQHIRPVQPLFVETEMDIPSNKRPSSPKGFKKFPRYEWRIEVLTKIAKIPDNKSTFPVYVL